jgi:hypothetical protein
VNYKILKYWPIPFPGYPIPFWVRNLEIIGKTIKELKLKPVPKEMLPRGQFFEGIEFIAMEKEIKPEFLDPGIRGGNRGPHLHYKGELYLLDAKQWKTFTSKIVADMSARLKSARNLAFDNLIEIEEGISGLPGME